MAKVDPRWRGRVRDIERWKCGGEDGLAEVDVFAFSFGSRGGRHGNNGCFVISKAKVVLWCVPGKESCDGTR